MPEGNESNESGSAEKIAVCCDCGDSGADARVTDKLKYKNKKMGALYIRYKGKEEKDALCRLCWEKNIKKMIEKMEGPNEKYRSSKNE